MAMIISGGISQTVVSPSRINTYGAIFIPNDEEDNSVQVDQEEVTNQEGKFKSALKNAGQSIKNAVTPPGQKLKNLATYMWNNKNELATTITSKFSGIAVTQALINGKVTSKEAIDYLFMGFAPALGVQGSLMGYSGLNQMKDALSNGSIDVGAFISGFSRTLKGATDLKNMLLNKDNAVSGQIIEIDLTISHSEQYQSETPDRRVQSGQSLNEYIHNMPETFNVSCALQEGKRYSKAEFRAIMQDIRNKKKPVQLILGDEVFDELVLTGFNPTHDCSKSGMDYELSFKKIIQSYVDTDTEVTIMEKPELVQSNDTLMTGSLGANKGVLGGMGDIQKYVSGELGNLYATTEEGAFDMLGYSLILAPFIGE